MFLWSQARPMCLAHKLTCLVCTSLLLALFKTLLILLDQTISGTNKFKILLVCLGRAVSSITSPVRLRSNTILLTFHIVLNEWLINLTPFSLGSMFSLAHPLSKAAMARFSLEIFQVLFKYACNSKENPYNNKANLFYHKGNLCYN